jgi:type IV pilus assembly protein PilW
MSKSTFHFHRSFIQQAGLSLVELMISVAIGLVLMVVIINIFLGSKNVYRSTDNQSRLQENGRYILEEMGRDIRMAGYRGCSKNSKLTNIAQPTTRTWINFNEAVRGYESIPGNPDIGLTAAEVLAGTDIIRVQSTPTSDVKLNGQLAAVNANIQITGNPDGFQADDILIISDCSNTDVFRANSVSTASGTTTITHSAAANTSVNLSKAYEANSEIMRLSTNIYYIGTGSGGCPANVLCRKVLNQTNLVVQELIDNVENVQLKYGEDTDGDMAANRFVDASSVTSWENIVSVQIDLLLRSNDANVATSPQPYIFNNGTSITPTDRRLRRIFSSTVALRNRIS